MLYIIHNSAYIHTYYICILFIIYLFTISLIYIHTYIQNKDMIDFLSDRSSFVAQTSKELKIFLSNQIYSCLKRD